MPDMTPGEWGEKYRTARGTYQSLVLRLQNLLKEILQSTDVDVVQVEARAKEVASFIDKIQRKEGRYSNPLIEMTDLAALRIIVYYREDVERVCDLIEQEFSVDWDNSMNKGKGLDVDRFGYNSVHYIATLSEGRCKLREWAPHKDIRFEIQVRTVLQHAWAAVNHKLDYKSANEAPSNLRRRLYRLSALFELADEQFSLVRHESQEIEVEYKNEVSEGNFDIPLNDISLRAYMESHPQVVAVKELMRSKGFMVQGEPAVDAVIKQMARLLLAIGITTLSDFDQALREDLPNTFEYLSRDVEVSLLPMITAALAIARGISDKEAFNAVYNEEGWRKYDHARKMFLKKMRDNPSGIKNQ